MNKVCLNNVNEYLKIYIETYIFPLYERNDEGHQITHILDVINRSFELCPYNYLDSNIIYTVASFHDIGAYIDRKNHEKISAEIMMKDLFLKFFFSDSDLIIIKDAIEDHRASSKTVPRNIYGMLVSSADRPIYTDDFIVRAYKAAKKYRRLSYQGECLDREITHEELIEAVYHHLVEKFGTDGYAKTYFEDSKYVEFIKQIAELINDKNKYYEKTRKLTF